MTAKQASGFEPMLIDEAGLDLETRERSKRLNEEVQQKMKQLEIMSIAQQIKNIPDSFFTEFKRILKMMDLPKEKEDRIIELLNKEKARRGLK